MFQYVKNTPFIVFACVLLLSCKDQTEELIQIDDHKMITVSLNLSSVGVEISQGRTTNRLNPEDFVNPFTVVLLSNKNHETRKVDQFYAAAVYEGVPAGIELDLVAGNEYIIFAKVIAASETSQGLALFEDANAQMQIRPSRPVFLEEDGVIHVSNDVIYGQEAVNDLGFFVEDQVYVNGFAKYIDEDGSLQSGENSPELDVYYKRSEFTAKEGVSINLELIRYAFAVRLTSGEPLEREYRARLDFVTNEEQVPRDYLKIGPGKQTDRKVLTSYSAGNNSFSYTLVIEQLFYGSWQEIYKEPVSFNILEETEIRLLGNTGKSSGLTFTFFSQEMGEGDPINVEVTCPEDKDKVITIGLKKGALNTPLPNHVVEVWDIDPNGDILVGFGITNSSGDTRFEVTNRLFDRVFNQSPNIYYKVVFEEELLSNSRDIQSPEYNAEIKPSVIAVEFKNVCQQECPLGINRLVTLNIYDRSIEAALQNHLVEMWDIKASGDRLVGFGVSDNTGGISFEVTEAMFAEIFENNSPSIYYKVFLDNQLVSSSRTIASPDYNNNIEVNVQNIAPVEICN